MRQISLALGGGGAKGIAHIGVIKALQQHKIQIQSISGTSIGSVIAAMYAKGYSPDDMADLFRQLDQTRLFGVPFSDGPGFLGYRGIRDFLSKVLGDTTFDQLHIPCCVVSVDLVSDSVIEISDGSVLDAVLASIAIPGIFPPRFMGDMVLVDGAVMDPIPVRSARKLGKDLPVAAVVLSGKYRLSQLSPVPMRSGKINAILVDQFARTSLSKTFKVFTDAIETSSRQVSELRLQLDQPDIIIRPAIEEIGILDVVDVDSVVKKGVDAANEQIVQYMKQQNMIKRWIEKFFR